MNESSYDNNYSLIESACNNNNSSNNNVEELLLVNSSGDDISSRGRGRRRRATRHRHPMPVVSGVGRYPTSSENPSTGITGSRSVPEEVESESFLGPIASPRYRDISIDSVFNYDSLTCDTSNAGGILGQSEIAPGERISDLRNILSTGGTNTGWDTNLERALDNSSSAYPSNRLPPHENRAVGKNSEGCTSLEESAVEILRRAAHGQPMAKQPQQGHGKKEEQSYEKEQEEIQPSGRFGHKENSEKEMIMPRGLERNQNGQRYERKNNNNREVYDEALKESRRYKTIVSDSSSDGSSGGGSSSAESSPFDRGTAVDNRGTAVTAQPSTNLFTQGQPFTVITDGIPPPVSGTAARAISRGLKIAQKAGMGERQPQVDEVTAERTASFVIPGKPPLYSSTSGGLFFPSSPLAPRHYTNRPSLLSSSLENSSAASHVDSSMSAIAASRPRHREEHGDETGDTVHSETAPQEEDAIFSFQDSTAPCPPQQEQQHLSRISGMGTTTATPTGTAGTGVPSRRRYCDLDFNANKNVQMKDPSPLVQSTAASNTTPRRVVRAKDPNKAIMTSLSSKSSTLHGDSNKEEISSVELQDALQHQHVQYRKWWLQEQFAHDKPRDREVLARLEQLVPLQQDKEEVGPDELPSMYKYEEEDDDDDDHDEGAFVMFEDTATIAAKLDRMRSGGAKNPSPSSSDPSSAVVASAAAWQVEVSFEEGKKRHKKNGSLAEDSFHRGKRDGDVPSLPVCGHQPPSGDERKIISRNDHDDNKMSERKDPPTLMEDDVDNEFLDMDAYEGAQESGFTRQKKEQETPRSNKKHRAQEGVGGTPSLKSAPMHVPKPLKQQKRQTPIDRSAFSILPLTSQSSSPPSGSSSFASSFSSTTTTLHSNQQQNKKHGIVSRGLDQRHQTLPPNSTTLYGSAETITHSNVIPTLERQKLVLQQQEQSEDMHTHRETDSGRTSGRQMLPPPMMKKPVPIRLTAVRPPPGPFSPSPLSLGMTSMDNEILNANRQDVYVETVLHGANRSDRTRSYHYQNQHSHTLHRPQVQSIHNDPSAASMRRERGDAVAAYNNDDGYVVVSSSDDDECMHPYASSSKVLLDEEDDLEAQVEEYGYSNTAAEDILFVDKGDNDEMMVSSSCDIERAEEQQPYSSSCPVPEDNKDNYVHEQIVTSQFSITKRTKQHVLNGKQDLLHALAISGGDVATPQFLGALNQLETLYNSTGWDARDPQGHCASSSGKKLEGMWLTLSKPTYQGCLGLNGNDEPMYTMGRMSFDMFRPKDLVCSLQGIFNPVQDVRDDERWHIDAVPKGLQEEIKEGDTLLRSYNIVTAFTIEPDSPAFGPTSPNRGIMRPIRGIMTTYGYVLPDPNTPNRLSIWFTGGRIDVNNAQTDMSEWRRIFETAMIPKRSFGDRAKLLAVKLLLGATVPSKLEEDGSMSFEFKRPIGGHGSHYVDVLYLDETLRIVKGHHGTVYVFTRVNE